MSNVFCVIFCRCRNISSSLFKQLEEDRNLSGRYNWQVDIVFLKNHCQLFRSFVLVGQTLEHGHLIRRTVTYENTKLIWSSSILPNLIQILKTYKGSCQTFCQTSIRLTLTSSKVNLVKRFENIRSFIEGAKSIYGRTQCSLCRFIRDNPEAAICTFRKEIDSICDVIGLDILNISTNLLEKNLEFVYWSILH